MSLKYPFLNDLICVHQLSILRYGKCTICDKGLTKGDKVYAGKLKDGTYVVACNGCKGIIDNQLKTYTYFPQETTLPTLNAKLWRYQDFAKFVSLLDSHQLFFNRADSFEDPFEGARGFHFQKSAIYSKMETYLKFRVKTRLNRTGNPPPTEDEIEFGVKEEMELFIKEQEEKRKHFFISCWHTNERESEGMWKLYTTAMNQGVAVQTTTERLCYSIGNDSFRIGNVSYVSFESPLAEEQTPIWYKRDAFTHEREVRVVIEDATYKDKGMPIAVDIDTLIEKIYVSPTAPKWLATLVKSVMQKYGVDKPVEYSQLTEKPIY